MSPPPAILVDRLTHFRPRLRSFLRRRVSCDATADDLTQETLAKAWASLPALRDPERLEAWLYRLARHTLVDHLRRRHPETGLEADALPEEADAQHREVARCVARAARCYLGTLPPRYREALRLAEEDGLAHAAVAHALGISLTAAKSRIRRGRAMLRAKLEACCRFEFDRRGAIVDCSLRQPCGARASAPPRPR